MAEQGFPRPRLLLSQCLELEACRYNAEMVRSGVVRLLAPFVELAAVCPEVEIGLGVPRPPIRLVARRAAGAGGADAADAADAAGPRLVQPSTGADLTERMAGWAHAYADGLGAIDGALLKSRSPSCGIKDVKVYAAAENSPPVGTEAGAFARVVMARWPRVAVEDEGRLTNAALRHHFLTRIYASARLREAVAAGPAGLVGFHTAYKLVLMAHSPAGQRELGRLVAEAGEDGFEVRADRYAEGLAAALSAPARVGSNVNVIQHAQGYFKRVLTAAEKRQFEALLAQYREGRAPLQALLAVLGSWVARFDEGYLRGQAYFRPYPEALVVAADSGRARLA